VVTDNIAFFRDKVVGIHQPDNLQFSEQIVEPLNDIARRRSFRNSSNLRRLDTNCLLRQFAPPFYPKV
jgi:hypothetical protein